MRISDFGRYALCSCAAAAVLAGCGGSQPPIGAPLSSSNAGLKAERTRPSVTYGLLYSFEGGSEDGKLPVAGLLNVNGTLYSTTSEGGANGFGTVFAVTKSGTETLLHSFGGAGDGRWPYAGLLNVTGTLYGTTNSGGTNCASNGCGTVFAITTSGMETVLYSFKGGSDGDSPYAGLLDVKGTLYSTTGSGGGSGCGGCGTVFKITTSRQETVLHTFGGSGDGVSPVAGLLDVKGKLYGTTLYGGANGVGTVFKITPSGKERVLHSFKGNPDGESPYAGLTNVGGTLYGTTALGGVSGNGTVFAITPSGKERVLYSFKGGPDGEDPNAGLTKVGGTLYGTTLYGGGTGCGIGCGTVFAITTSGTERVLYSFNGEPDGEHPWAGLSNVGGALYGTTANGGVHGYGTVFWLTP